MNIWLFAAFGLLVSLAPCAMICLRGEPIDRLVGLELAGILNALLFVCLAEGTGRTSFLDVALALGLLTFGGGLVFARFMERWI